MKSKFFSALSTILGVGSAVAAKALIGQLWPTDPPKNPADRSVAWKQALQWAVVSSLGAGMSRLVARRLAAAGWETATGEAPPGIETS